MTPRANEQVFNNANEATNVLYAGTLVGIVPGGPGHSHWELGLEPWRVEWLEPGRGTVVDKGSRAVVVCTGPVLDADSLVERLLAL